MSSNCDNEKPIHLWIKYHVSYFRRKPGYHRSHKYNIIPKELKFDGWQTSEGDEHNKPIHYWIKYRQGEPIPDELKFEGW